jgi:hypothetical protein
MVMVHENDEAAGGCEFARFFETTPQAGVRVRIRVRARVRARARARARARVRVRARDDTTGEP